MTVISGTLYMGLGDKLDEKVARAMPAGSYGHGRGCQALRLYEGRDDHSGPRQRAGVVEYVNPNDDPRKKK